MPALVSTWSVANILKLPSSEGTVQYTLHGMSTTMAAGPAKNPLCSEGRADCKGLEAQTQQRHITGNEFDFLTLNGFYFGSLALVVFACVFLGPTSSRTDHEDQVNLSPIGHPHSEGVNHLRAWGSFQHVGSALPESSPQKVSDGFSHPTDFPANTDPSWWRGTSTEKGNHQGADGTHPGNSQ